MAQTVLILDFGGQYKELIARRVRECSVYSIVKAGDLTAEQVQELNPIGIILTGGPNSVYLDDSPHCDKRIFELGIPVLGICYGAQLTAWSLGGTVTPCAASEYGKTAMEVDPACALFKGLSAQQIGLMSHTDQITVLPQGFTSTAHTVSCPNAAMACPARKIYAVQFHPEVESTPNGTQIIRNFLYEVCGAAGDYNLKDLEKQLIQSVREQVGSAHVLLALSGGVDSSVAAALLQRAVGDQLTCIFVDHGLLRKDEGDQVEQVIKHQFHVDVRRVNAGPRFLSKLAGVTEPEHKRKIIGEEFIRVFEEEAKKIGAVDFLAQGTIYPDVVESGLGGESVVIKSHHNVGGLPDCVDFKEIVEPLRRLFKDEVRKLGTELGLPDELVWRQPFPGPGLAIRVIGDITEEKLTILREADAIFREEMKLAGLDRTTSQFFAVLTDLRSVGVMGDERTYDYTLALRAVQSQDFMTATWSRLPYELLDKVSGRIVGEVKHINRICYDITSKPPATVEWE